jgi:hypothetical protein
MAADLSALDLLVVQIDGLHLEKKRRLGRDLIVAAKPWHEHDKAVERQWSELRSRATRSG